MPGFPPRYATLYHLRRRGVPKDLLDDEPARELLDEISRWVEEYTQQIFYPRNETVDLDGLYHRMLHHDNLWPILCDSPTVSELPVNSRERVSTRASSSTILQLTADQFSVRSIHPRRHIFKHHGVWNEGSLNYRVVAWWGWLSHVHQIDFTLAQNFDGTSDRLYLTSVAGLRVHDVGVLPDETVLYIVEIDAVNNYVTVDGGDLLQTAAVIDDTFARWGQVPQGIRKFVLEATYLSSGAEEGASGGSSWLRRERTDTYEYERFSPSDMGMSGGDFWTGNTMIDSGMTRYRRPGFIGLV